MAVALDGFLVGLTSDDGGVIVETGVHAPVWTALDTQLAPRWRVERRRSLPVFERHLVEDGMVQRIERDGSLTPLVRVPALDEAKGAARVLAVRPDGFVVARAHVIARIDRDGRLLWPAARTLSSMPTAACVSGDRLLVATELAEYTAWGYLGPLCLLDLADGRLVRELRGDAIAPLDDAGHFVTTLEGYDVFDTWLYDRDGTELQRWRSSGHLVPDPDGTVRVIEMDRSTPTRSRIVRLHRDGSIERGPELRDSQCSPPLVLDDGRLVFVEGGHVRAVDRALGSTYLAELAPVPESDHWRFHARLARGGGRIFVALCERLPESAQPQMPGRTAADMLERTYLHAL